MLRVELTQQLLRLRTMIALLCLAAVPVIAGLTTASTAGRRNGSQGGLFGASTFSALNHAAASLQFIGPLLLPIVVALLASAIGGADRDWGTLRYLYVQPVNVRRLITGKLLALVVSCLAATGCVLAVVCSPAWRCSGGIGSTSSAPRTSARAPASCGSSKPAATRPYA